MSKYNLTAARENLTSVVVGSLFIAAPIVCGGSVFFPCYVTHYLVSFLVCNHLEWER